MGYKNPTFSVDVSGYHFVFLGLYAETKGSTAHGGIAKTRVLLDEDLQWLKDDIKKNKLPSLVFLHYGVAEDDMKGNWWFERSPEHALLQNRKDLKKILKTDKNLLAVFSGHQHWTKRIVEDGIKYFVLGSLVEDVHGNGVPEGIWLEVDIDGKEIKVKERNMEFKHGGNG
jgi:hypothetical protein